MATTAWPLSELCCAGQSYAKDVPHDSLDCFASDSDLQCFVDYHMAPYLNASGEAGPQAVRPIMSA